MKKILFLIILFGLQGYGQKTLEIYNFCPYTLAVLYINTSASGAYPQFKSNFPPTIIMIAPGDSYILQNTADPDRFPFDSPLSSPYVNSWLKTNPPSPPANVTSNAAWLQGDDQTFDSLQYRLLDPATSNGIIGEPTPMASGPGWNAIYEMSANPPNQITYTVVFFP